jgi:hypothetical protein
MASFAGDEEKQYPGFVRRASSGYDKYYPADKQIQLYTPKPAPFYGQTTAGDSYKKWEVQPKPRVDEDMAPPPHIPFSGTTTNRADFHAHPLERREDREAVEYSPSKAPFYGQTTAGDSYKKWEVQPKPRVDEDMAPPPHIPFSGTTTNRADFHAHPLERREDREAVAYQPSNAPFYGQTTAGDSYKAWEIQPKPRVDGDMAPPPYIPFTGTTTNRADFRRYSLGAHVLSLGVATRGGVFFKLIKSTDARPTQASQVFTTVQDNQTVVRIQVYQGEREIAMENELLGQFELPGITPAPMGVPQIEVLFDINAKNELAVVARDTLTGNFQEVRFVASQIQLDRDQVKEAVGSAKKARREDSEQKTLIQAKNSAENTIYEVQKRLAASGSSGLLNEDIAYLRRAIGMDESPASLMAAARDLVRKEREIGLYR